ncbi:MAG TPA: transporter [Desulfotomaculum sp.]|nr:transporter [Desulfotomaculum sp.]
MIGDNKKLCSIKQILAVLVTTGILMASSLSFAARPLVTDDSGTVGKKTFQAELGIESSSRKDTEDNVEVKETQTELSGVFTYGITNTIDFVFGFPYAWKKVKEDGETVFDANKFNDTSIEVKWRFFEKDGFGLALKPGISLPTGNDEKGFGTGRIGYGLTFIASKEIEPFGFHFNAGYSYNDNRIDERKDIWSVSTAVTYEVIKNMRLVADIGIQRNTNPEVQTSPAFGLLGMNYSINKNIMLDAGYKFGLNKQEADNTVIAGITLIF